MKLSHFFCLLGCFWGLSAFMLQDEISPKIIKSIQKQLRKMEKAAKANQMQGVAAIYLDNAYLLSSNAEPIKGRVQINDYWLKLKDVKDWTLESKLFTTNTDKIYAHPHYQSLKNKPPDWKHLNLDLKNIVYEIGISRLTTQWQGKSYTSVVTYILLWKKQAKGDYKILIDTYSFE